MTVKSLHVYPVKGMGGIELQEANMFERGVQFDRRWMLVDKDGEFITQRTVSKIALFQCRIDNALHVSYKRETISWGFEEYTDVKILTTVWENEVFAFEVNRKVSNWFSNQLEIDCRLVRMVDEFHIYKKLIKGPKQTKVSFADGYPYSIIGTASLGELSKRVGINIPANRFRANIIVHTKIAHEEDLWDELQIGSAKLQVIKPSARCLVVNIDQTSAENKKQPLKELASYRMEDNKVNFGANTICLVEGVVRVGDSLHFTD